MKSKVLVKVLKVVLALVLALFVLSSSALALCLGDSYTWGGTYNNGGVLVSNGTATCNNITYYIDASQLPNPATYYQYYSSFYETAISNAFQSWANKTAGNSANNARVTFSRIYTNNASFKIIIVPASTLGTNRGNTTFPVDQNYNNYNSCTIYLADNLMTYGATAAQRTVGHEIGHGLGLCHPNLAMTKNSIMFPYNEAVSSNLKADTPSDTDNFNITNLYK